MGNRPSKALCTLLPRTARAVDAAEGGPPVPVDGGFDGWLILSASSASRLNVSTSAAAGAYAHTAFRGHNPVDGTRGVKRLSGLRRPPIYGRMKLEGVRASQFDSWLAMSPKGAM